MKHLSFFAILAVLIFQPGVGYAFNGVNQYGQSVDYATYEVVNNVIPPQPDLYTGSITKSAKDLTFFMPSVPKEQMTTQPEVMGGALVVNEALDVSYCDGSMIFAQGRYDADGRARVRPVCADIEWNVLGNNVITTQDTYGDIRVEVDGVVQEVYHYTLDSEGNRVFTDKAPISKLVGKAIKGSSDTTYYTVLRGEEHKGIRQISVGYAKMLAGGGDGWEKNVVRFDDSIIYSYPIGSRLR